MRKENAPDRNNHYAMALRIPMHVGDTLETLSRKLGLNKTAVVITAIRELAERHDIPYGDHKETT